MEFDPEIIKSEMAELSTAIVEGRAASFRHGLLVGLALGWLLGMFCDRIYAAEIYAPVASAGYAPRIYKLDLSYQKILENNDPMLSEIPGNEWSDAVSLDVGVEVGRLYIDANPHFESAYHKVTSVGLLMHTGIRIFDWLDFEYMHHSRHSADSTNSYTPYDTASKKYPLWDSVGAVVHFVPGARK